MPLPVLKVNTTAHDAADPSTKVWPEGSVGKGTGFPPGHGLMMTEILM